MPSISMFYRITIHMYFLAKEHNPPHIHACYENYSAIIRISDGAVLEGKLPNNALKLLRKWISIHKEELQTMWENQIFKRIPPLKERENYVS